MSVDSAEEALVIWLKAHFSSLLSQRRVCHAGQLYHCLRIVLTHQHSCITEKRCKCFRPAANQQHPDHVSQPRQYSRPRLCDLCNNDYSSK